mgnify:CR=1 FL=1
MIKKMKSRLSVKVFLLTLLLTATCSFTTYSFILQAAPKNYQYDIEDADLELVFLPAEFSRTEKEYRKTDTDRGSDTKNTSGALHCRTIWLNHFSVLLFMVSDCSH